MHYGWQFVLFIIHDVLPLSYLYMISVNRSKLTQIASHGLIEADSLTTQAHHSQCLLTVVTPVC